jgi:hypothetical protein
LARNLPTPNPQDLALPDYGATAPKMDMAEKPTKTACQRNRAENRVYLPEKIFMSVVSPFCHLVHGVQVKLRSGPFSNL